jgi:4-hydroxy-tetrahydrodipicolinate synthase
MLSVLPRGIVPVLQTPFDEKNALDFDSLGRLIEHALAGGAASLLVPAVASEVSTLAPDERRRLMQFTVRAAEGRAPVIGGCSAPTAEECAQWTAAADAAGASAILISPPEALRNQPEELAGFLRRATERCELPLIVQDLDWTGEGISFEALLGLRERLPRLAGVKVETAVAGPKYTKVRKAFGSAFHISGGWAIAQMIEAMDRGVDAFIPEASIVRLYSAIWRTYESGRRDHAIRLFRELLPVIAFTHQEIRLSIAFYKRWLVRKGIFRTAAMRLEGFAWDSHSLRIADELIEHLAALEARPIYSVS